MGRRRKHGKIDDLSQELQDAVEQMLLSNCRYSDIVDYLATQSIAISTASICRYAQDFHANVERLKIAQENFRRMTEELAKYPNLDTTEAIIRLASNNVYNALGNIAPEDWASIAPEKLLRETTGLIRAAMYKKDVEIKNKAEFEKGLDAVKGVVFEAMARKRPELYAQVVEFVDGMEGKGS